jgi:multidrug resistance protein, MATE family
MTSPAELPLTDRRVLRIALPIVLSNATVPLLGAVDTAVVGQMGLAAPIGAVGLGAIVLASLYWLFGFLRMGTSGLAAQAEGAGDRVESVAILLRALIIAVITGFALIALQVPLIAGAFALAPASDEVEGLARSYLSIRIWGAPATIATYALTGWLVAREKTSGILWLQLWTNGVNIVLDLWFVLGLGWGVEGVAIATLIAEYSGLILALLLCRSAFSRGILPPARARLGDKAALLRMWAVNGNLMLRSVLLQGSFTTFMFLGAGFGDVTLAANQVLLQFLEITAYALDGLAFAAETLVGQAVGARRSAQVRQATMLTGKWGAIGAALLGLIFLALGPQIIDLMAKAPEVQAEARHYLPWLIAAPLIGIASWILDGVFIGATLTREMRRCMLWAVAIYGVSLLILLPLLGNHGLWAALMVLNLARGVTMAWAYPAAERAAA